MHLIKRVLYIFSCVILFVSAIYGQTPKNKIKYLIGSGNDTISIDPEEVNFNIPNSFIVKLKETTSSSRFDAKSEFLRELKIISANRNSSFTIKGELRNLMSAYVIETDESTINSLKSRTDLIEKIYPNHKVKAFDVISNNVIGAPTAWNPPYNLKGAGVKIAIIDTGVELNHPAFGGKVISGYDFVNNDNNPTDDHGHGTHCAGIAAANSASLMGVAPEADIMAVKVLNASGSGNAADIALGIDYAIDPDGNPTTDDGADVLSISLGALVKIDGGIMVDVIELATQKGVLSVVAAGNDGPQGNYTIGNPGTAASALTVGASFDDVNFTAFSSIGPTFGTSLIKPEIVAPGQGISSATLNGGILSLSGTSMATPHVAGAVAILRQYNPNLSPIELKNILVNNTNQLTNNSNTIFNVGNGLLNIPKCLETKSVVHPAILNIGQVPINQDSIKIEKWIKIKNNFSVSTEYRFKILDNINSLYSSQSGLEFDFLDSIIIGPNQSDSILVKISAKVNELNFVNIGVNHFRYVLQIAFDGKAIKVPIVLMDEFYFFLKVKKPANSFNFTKIKGKSNNEFFAFGIDSIYTMKSIKLDSVVIGTSFENYRILTNGKTKVNFGDTISIDYNDIKHKITYKTLDHKGDSLFTVPGGISFLYHKDFSLTLPIQVSHFYDINFPTYEHSIYSSNMENGWEYQSYYESQTSLNKYHTYYHFPFIIDSIKNDSILEIDPCKIILKEFSMPNFNDYTQVLKFNGTRGIGSTYINIDTVSIKNKIYKEYHYPTKNIRKEIYSLYINNYQYLQYIDSNSIIKRYFQLNYITGDYFRNFFISKFWGNTLVNKISKDKIIWQDLTLKTPLLSYNTSFLIKDQANDSILIINSFYNNSFIFSNDYKLNVVKLDTFNNVLWTNTFLSKDGNFGKIPYSPSLDKYLELSIENLRDSMYPNKIKLTFIDKNSLFFSNSGLQNMYCLDSLGKEQYHHIKGKSYQLIIGNNGFPTTTLIKRIGDQDWITLPNLQMDPYVSSTFSLPQSLDTGKYEVKFIETTPYGITEYTTALFSVHNSIGEFCKKKVLSSKNDGESSLREAIYCVDAGEEITFMDNIDEITLTEDLNLDKNLTLKHNNGTKPLILKLKNNAKVNIKNTAIVKFENVIIEKCKCQ